MSTSNALVKVEPKVGFSNLEIRVANEYVAKHGPVTLAPSTTEKMVELYLSGSSLVEIAKSYPEVDPGSIYFTAHHFDWPSLRDEFSKAVQSQIKQKILYSKYQQLELVSNMIKVAYIESNQAMLAYIKSPNERNLPRALRIKTIKDLSNAIEMMSQVIGQDNNKNITIMGQIDTTVNESAVGPKAATTVSGALTDSVAKSLMAVLNRPLSKKQEELARETLEAEVVDGEEVETEKE